MQPQRPPTTSGCRFSVSNSRCIHRKLNDAVSHPFQDSHLGEPRLLDFWPVSVITRIIDEMEQDQTESRTAWPKIAECLMAQFMVQAEFELGTFLLVTWSLSHAVFILHRK